MRAFLVPFFTAFGVSLALVPLAGLLARMAGAVAQPRADRWHTKPTPLFGGVAIAVTTLACAVGFDGFRSQPVLLACVSLVFVLGLVDDILGLRPSTKLVGQVALASVLLFFHYRLGWTRSFTFDSLLTVLWVVGITNAFNLLDNMDGLCGGIGLIAGVAFLVSFWPSAPGTPEFLAARYAAVLSGALAGFLVYNTHPASIFMGDSGSLFVGLSFAALAVVPDRTPGRDASLLPIVVAPMALLIVPILDTTLVTVSRLLSGRSAATGGRDHSSHRLVAIGLSEPTAVAVLWALAAMAGGVGIAARHLSQSWSALIALVFLAAMMIFAVFLARVRVYEEADLSRIKTDQITPVVAELFYKRPAAEVLLDLFLVMIAYYGAYRLRFDDAQFATNFPYFLNSLPVVLATQMVAQFGVGAYRGSWKHFGLADAVTFGKSVVIGAIGAQLILLYLYRFESYSRAAFPLYGTLLFLMFAGSRASFRLINEFARRRRHTGIRVVVYGAGDGGTIATREMMESAVGGYRMIGFIDDDPRKRRMRLHGYPVLGGYDHLKALLQERGVDAVVISARRFDPARQREIEELCRTHGVALSRLRIELEPLVHEEAPPSSHPHLLS
jgi:UDP-GlcNAc:undecaprenyl-phosphate GlcNAc-1-phosphate transferase